MKFFDRLERNKTFWFLFGLSLVFFFLRLPSLIEPNWYGDEGIYQVIGIALNNDRPLYSGIWDNKPPLLYLIYGLFQGNQFGTRVFSLFFGLLTLWAFLSLSQKLFPKGRSSIVATIFFTLVFALPLFEGNIANAENFMLLPIIVSGFLVYQFSLLKKSPEQYHFVFNPQHIMLGGAGFLLGIAFLIKSVAIFDFFAFFLFLIFVALSQSWKPSRSGIKILLHYLFVHFLLYIGGFLTPIIIASFYFIFQGTFIHFFQAAFIGNISYVGYANSILFSHSLLFIKALFLIFVLGILFLKRNKLSKPTLFILIWTAFSLFNTLFSQRPYTHYILVSIPALSLFLGFLVHKQSPKRAIFLATTFLAFFISLTNIFYFSDIKKTFLYYHNAALFLTGQKNVASYQSFFDSRVPRDYEIASFLKMHTKQNEPIFIWGDNPQIYVLSETLPINQYTVSYHILQQKDALVQTQRAINLQKPRFIVILAEAPAFPFHIPDYSYKFAFDNAVLYERSF